MRLTYTDIKNQFLRNINLVGTTDANILADFNANLGQRYQLVLARLKNYKTQKSYSFSTGINVTKSNVSQIVSSITSSGTTATVTTAVAHGYSNGNSVEISGATPIGYNGTYTITVVTTTTFTYTLNASVNGVSASVSPSSPFPPGVVTVEGGFITVGSVNYPLRGLNSRWNDEQLNAILIQASAVPQFYFVEQDSFKIWPIPQTTYSGTLYYHYRDRNLSVADYTTGTVTLTQGLSQIVGAGGAAFTSAMVGRWFTVTDPAVPGQGYWYRITGYVDSTHLNLGTLTGDQVWTNATVTTGSGLYRIGESPEFPEEGHQILAHGVTADYYMGMRKDPANATLYNNLFWTGDPNNSNRAEGTENVMGGLLGLIDTYKDRDDRHLIKRKPKLNPLQYRVWATSLS